MNNSNSNSNSNYETLIAEINKCAWNDATNNLAGVTIDYATAETISDEAHDWLRAHGYRLCDIGGELIVCTR